MGLFSGGYMKEGKGVNPDEPKKRSFFRLNDIFFRKFMHFVKVSMLYCVTMLPTFLLVLAAVFTVMFNIFANGEASSGVIAGASLLVSAFVANLYATLLGMGPVTAGATYVLRNFANEEHAWIWSDFKDAFKSNLKQSVAVYFINLAVIIVLYVAIAVYSSIGGALGYLRYFMYMILLTFAMMGMYIYPMMVTFKLKIRELYKNAFLFALGKLPSNLLTLAIVVFLHIGLPYLAVMYCGKYYLVVTLVLLLLEFFVTQAYAGFIVNFNVYPKMKEYMMGDTEAEKEQALFEDDVNMS